MIRAIVRKLDSTVLDHGDFISQELAIEWFQPFIDKGVYGSPEKTVVTEEGSEIIPAEFEIIFEEITPSAEELRLQKIQLGASARRVCQDVLDLIAGHNLDRELSIEQITIMQQTFDLAEKALRAGRPTLAKAAIQAVTPDGILVTQEMKDEALALLAGY